MTRQITVKNIKIGGGAPISIQSMTNTPTLDTERTIAQIFALKKAGCDIVRIAVSSDEEVEKSKTVLKNANVPLVADIQFDYRHAVKCADIGFDKIRFNPGYLSTDKVSEVVKACKANGVPIRVGVNSGSVDKEILEKYSGAEALCESALKHIAVLEKCGFYDTIISVKSSSVITMVQAYEMLASRCDYPLHLGVTESGSAFRGAIKSSVGIGSLLLKGIGDTIRVSLTGDPVKEVETAKLILASVGKGKDMPEIVSCPTCSRCEYDMESIVDKIEKALEGVNKKIKIAVMGCVVNGPGEAKDADIAVCGGGKGKAVLYKSGKLLKTINGDDAVAEVLKLIEEF